MYKVFVEFVVPILKKKVGNSVSFRIKPLNRKGCSRAQGILPVSIEKSPDTVVSYIIPYISEIIRLSRFQNIRHTNLFTLATSLQLHFRMEIAHIGHR